MNDPRAGRRRGPRRRGPGERGSAAVELVLVTPLLLAMFFFIVQLGRLVHTEGSLDGAARDAARAASIARTGPEADAAARAAAESSVDENDIPCVSAPTVDVNLADFRSGGSVTVTVACDVDFSAAPIAGTPQSVYRSATFVAPVDELSFRG